MLYGDGRKRFNKFKITGELGSGGCGIVYEVERLGGRMRGIHAALKAETVDITKRRSESLIAEVIH